MQTLAYGDDIGTILSITVARASTIDVDDEAQITTEVRRLFGDVDVIDTRGYDWAADPFARGAWPAYSVGQLSRLPDLQQPEGRLFFGGSITANGWHEFIDGAIESGLRTAREVQIFLDGDGS